ncbi:hypothetical protein GPJ56_009113 [Histomonas meleagridis]|uniref:uncharacterized protein n=1 Tax=Histomonas meleagridis TaxID=135588 RepID=UPI003559B833|nr:hypothetical protein GPJ56_009113 [Histomonas meleagridis]KAH0799230.1 hypothetical protein GO595_008027 [Histomonas meleagridis]
MGSFRYLKSKKHKYIATIAGNEDLEKFLAKKLAIPFIETPLEDATMFLIGISNIIYETQNIDYGLLRNPAFVQYICDYFEYIFWNETIGDLNNKFLIVSRLISYFLRYRIFQPSEILTFPSLMPKIKQLTRSADRKRQKAGSSVYSLMIQSGDVPEIVLKQFYPLAITLDTSFHSNKARIACLHFLGQLFMTFPGLAHERIVEIFQIFHTVLTNKKLNGIYCDVLDAMRMAITAYPELLFLMAEMNLVDLANLLLKSSSSRTKVAAYRFFSTVFTTHSQDELLPLTDKLLSNSILLSIDDIDEKISMTSTQLLVDILSCGQLFIDMFMYGCNNLIQYILDDDKRDFKQKVLLFHASYNIFVIGSPEQCANLFSSDLLGLQCEEACNLENEIAGNFLDGMITGMSKICTLESFEELKNKILEMDVCDSVSNLLDSEDASIAEMAQVFLNYFK